jgi:DNA-binding IclR family transcriptional regulator
MSFTIEDVADKFNIDKGKAYGLVRGLESIGVVVNNGRKKTIGRKGSRLTFDLTASFSDVFHTHMETLGELSSTSPAAEITTQEDGVTAYDITMPTMTSSAG